MTAKSHIHGHVIETLNSEWVYSDTKEPTVGSKPRLCNHCGSDVDPDKCMGMLPGVMNACCGHGDREASYIQFENGVTIRGFIIDPSL